MDLSNQIDRLPSELLRHALSIMGAVAIDTSNGELSFEFGGVVFRVFSEEMISVQTSAGNNNHFGFLKNPLYGSGGSTPSDIPQVVHIEPSGLSELDGRYVMASMIDKLIAATDSIISPCVEWNDDIDQMARQRDERRVEAARVIKKELMDIRG